MQLELNDREPPLLRRILEQYLSDLRMEVSKTENYDMRTELKDDEAAIKGMIERLSAAGVVRDVP